MAEGVRFELTREQSPLPVFKTGALNHSATLPQVRTLSTYRYMDRERLGNLGQPGPKMNTNTFAATIRSVR
jgi:hypothetical protein